jgi:hypothetical protein
MMRRAISAILLTATLGIAAPATVFGDDQSPRILKAADVHVRVVLDPFRHDYHRWTPAEERSYRGYLAEHHRSYVSYARQREAERRAYWRWRHEREERLEHARR